MRPTIISSSSYIPTPFLLWPLSSLFFLARSFFPFLFRRRQSESRTRNIEDKGGGSFCDIRKIPTLARTPLTGTLGNQILLTVHVLFKLSLMLLSPLHVGADIIYGDPPPTYT